MVWRWREGGDCVRWWIMAVISDSVGWEERG